MAKNDLGQASSASDLLDFSTSRSIFRISIFLSMFYGLSLLVSMAGMEIFSWSLFLVFLISVFRLGKAGKSKGNWGMVLGKLKVGPDVWLWLFASVVLIGGILSPSPKAVWWAILGDSRWILLLYTFVWLWDRFSISHFEKYMRVAFIIAFILGVYACIQFFTGVNIARSKSVLEISWILNGRNYYRATGFFSMCLTFAYAIGMMGFVAAGQLWPLNKNSFSARLHLVPILGAVGGALICIFSIARGAWVASLATIMIMVILTKPKAVWKYLLGIASLGAIAIFSSDLLRDRIASILSFAERSNWLRLAIWRANWLMFLDHPTIGVGLGMNGSVTKEYFERLNLQNADVYSHAHNNFLNMLSGTGILGLVAFTAFAFYFLRLAYRCWKNSISSSPNFLNTFAAGSLGAQIYLHLGGMTECNFTDAEVNHMLISIWAVTVVISRRMSSIPKPASVLEKV